MQSRSSNWAAEAGDCVDPKTVNLSPGPCEPPLRPVADGFSDPGLYAKMIDAFSMRNWQYSGQSGHDHFFDAFGKYWQASKAQPTRCWPKPPRAPLRSTRSIRS